MKKRLLALAMVCALPALAQVNTGELRLRITDTAGLGLRAHVTVTGLRQEYRKTFSTDTSGALDLKGLPFGLYVIRSEKTGFVSAATSVEVRSEVPDERTMMLGIASVVTVVEVKADATLVDPGGAGSVARIGAEEIGERVGSLPGRSVQDLVNSQPGWLYEGNAVLHPRGSEYQTQFVVDGIPLTDNRSPSFGPEVEADDLDSMSIYTAGIPAEYGRKMGGVVELNTHRDTTPGMHGQVVLSGGSYDSASGYGHAQEVWGRNLVGGSASGAMTAHYLNPVVPENYTNRGTTGDFSTRFERDLNDTERLTFNVRHELSRFDIPNELVQEQAGQVQEGDNFETMGSVGFRKTFSADSLLSLVGMVRDNANDLRSNEDSTPIIAFQHNRFREGYFKGTFSLHHGAQELKAGVESDTTFLHEDFNYSITDPTQFDPDTPATLEFTASKPDLEQSGFVEDSIRLGQWRVSAGLRWDHYQLLLNQNAFSPRLSLARSFPKHDLVLHASYDRVFQTPSFENILISSSAAIDALSGQFLRLPVQPSKGNYFEGGVSKGLFGGIRIDANVYRRDVRNFADDDQLLNTGVSYPIAFDKALIYGAEAKVEVVRTRRLSGFASYSYMVGNAWYPVTGGLFLGDDAGAAAMQTAGHFPVSQDQRNTVRTRYQYRVGPRVWLASGMSYGSGLPFQYTGDQADALAQYGPAVVSRVNFERGRIRPLLAVNASMGVDLYKSERLTTRVQVDGENLNNRLNVIDFGGLFSGNAIGPGRSWGARLNTSF